MKAVRGRFHEPLKTLCLIQNPGPEFQISMEVCSFWFSAHVLCNAAAQCPVPPVKNTGAVPDSRLEGEARMIEIISDTRKCYGCYRGYSKKYYKGFKIKKIRVCLV